MAEQSCVSGSDYIWQDVGGTPLNGSVWDFKPAMASFMLGEVLPI